MKTTELIEFFKNEQFTDTVGYNLLIDDLYQGVSEAEVVGAQDLIRFFMYKIQIVLFPVIRDLVLGNKK